MDKTLIGNKINNIKCSFHFNPKENKRQDYREESVEKSDRLVWTTYKNDNNEVIKKLVRDNCEYFLIRDRKTKMDVWEIYDDFNEDNMYLFIRDWDSIYNKDEVNI